MSQGETSRFFLAPDLAYGDLELKCCVELSGTEVKHPELLSQIGDLKDFLINHPNALPLWI